MDKIKNFKNFFESIPDCREIVISLFSNKKMLIHYKNVGFKKNDIYRLILKYKMN